MEKGDEIEELRDEDFLEQLGRLWHALLAALGRAGRWLATFLRLQGRLALADRAVRELETDRERALQKLGAAAMKLRDSGSRDLLALTKEMEAVDRLEERIELKKAERDRIRSGLSERLQEGKKPG